jgi:ubiquinone/menaquinone biosynthesis C-methylase UbiE
MNKENKENKKNNSINKNSFLTRFSRKAEMYSKYRPTYPDEVMSFLENKLGLTEGSRIADIGSGTGIFSKQLLDKGFVVYAVEPNDNMRTYADQILNGYHYYHSINGTSENTGLKDKSVDLVTAATSFHWFDYEKAKVEFKRILKNGSYVVLLWNYRKEPISPFTEELEEIKDKYRVDKIRGFRYDEVSFDEKLNYLFDGDYDIAKFDNFRYETYKELIGNITSHSSLPNPEHEYYSDFLNDMKSLFWKYQYDGKILIERETNVFFGKV